MVVNLSYIFQSAACTMPAGFKPRTSHNVVKHETTLLQPELADTALGCSNPSTQATQQQEFNSKSNS